ncbi:hypothetical protein [Streptomyces sp. MMBL 11-1]|uniref:hypothetical protein n=1 Tax=Streptomyces sp. MMBL 11-1 TaxID=3026420 RepID=UPI0023627ED1|nr:hypothetical protein [Streptomyces sp. MMBL 11-1]
MKNDLKTLGTAALVGFALISLGLAVSAYFSMIVVGMWHGHNDAVPALGFVDCLYGVGLFSILTGLGAYVKRD